LSRRTKKCEKPSRGFAAPQGCRTRRAVLPSAHELAGLHRHDAGYPIREALNRRYAHLPTRRSRIPCRRNERGRDPRRLPAVVLGAHSSRARVCERPCGHHAVRRSSNRRYAINQCKGRVVPPAARQRGRSPDRRLESAC
jgi:hypothetical protein